MKKIYLVIVPALFFGTFGFSQKALIGVVKDSKGNSVPGAVVSIKGTKISTT